MRKKYRMVPYRSYITCWKVQKRIFHLWWTVVSDLSKDSAADICEFLEKQEAADEQ